MRNSAVNANDCTPMLKKFYTDKVLYKEEMSNFAEERHRLSKFEQAQLRSACTFFANRIIKT